MFVLAEEGIDLEAEVAVITGDVKMGATPAAAAQAIRLLLLVNDVATQPDSRRTGEGLRLPSVQAGIGVQPGGGDARRTRRRLARRPVSTGR